MLEDTYIKIITLKTSSFFQLLQELERVLLEEVLKEKNALESYGKNLGLAFQIADDALDYYAKELVFGKEIGKDFFER